MRKLLVLSFLMVSLCSNAQKVLSGSFELPVNEKYLTLDWDCSETIIDKKYNEKEWQSVKGDDWPKAKMQVLERIVSDTNDHLKKSRIIVVLPGSELKGLYTLYICPIKLDSKGNNKTNYILRDGNGNEVGKAQFNGDGGHWGTYANLLGDGYENAGSKLASLIKKYNKNKK
jgi:hypothetical protein